MTEVVNHPAHYGGDTIYETIKVIRAWGLNSNFALGNAIKYISRAGKKPGASALEDLKKARWYLDNEISALEPPQNTTPLGDPILPIVDSPDDAPEEQTPPLWTAKITPLQKEIIVATSGVSTNSMRRIYSIDGSTIWFYEDTAEAMETLARILWQKDSADPKRSRSRSIRALATRMRRTVETSRPS